MDATRLNAALQPHVDHGDCVGLTWLVADADEVFTGSLGASDEDGRHPVDVDTIYRTASLTKPVVAAAALLLVEREVLRLDDAVERHIPDLADWRVLASADAPLDATVAADRSPTVEDLLTSRLGVGWDFSDLSSFDQPVMTALGELSLGAGPPQPQGLPPTDEWVRRFATVPLERQPGTTWLYDTSLLVLGVVVERSTGMRLGDALDALVFAPLGMGDTAFHVSDHNAERLGPCYSIDADTGERSVYDPADGQWRHRPLFEAGNGGLVSTVTDYFAFVDALRKGTLLGPEMVEAMTTNHLSAEQLAGSAPEPGGGLGWGYGLGVRVGEDELESPGTYGWEGGLGSTWRTDPERDRVAILLTNTAWLNPAGAAVRERFRDAVFHASGAGS